MYPSLFMFLLLLGFFLLVTTIQLHSFDSKFQYLFLRAFSVLFRNQVLLKRRCINQEQKSNCYCEYRDNEKRGSKLAIIVLGTNARRNGEWMTNAYGHSFTHDQKHMIPYWLGKFVNTGRNKENRYVL
jgi:stress response protein SCP2